MSLAALLVVGLAGLAGILWQWRRAEAESLKFQVRSYVADMDLANRAVDEGDLGTAKGLLRRYWPELHQADLRNWEWRYLANLSEGDPHFSLVAHSTDVLSLRFLDDNTLLTAGETDWRTVLWNLKERRPSNIITNRGFGGGVSEVMAVAPKRSAMFYRVAYGSASRLLVVDFQTGTETNLFDEKGVSVNVEAPVKSLDISRDEKVLAVAYGKQVGLWDLDQKTWLETFETESGLATQGLFSPDGRVLVVAGQSARIAFWNLAEPGKLGVLTNTSTPDGLAF
jgi:WD40 repeat protein